MKFQRKKKLFWSIQFWISFKNPNMRPSEHIQCIMKSNQILFQLTPHCYCEQYLWARISRTQATGTRRTVLYTSQAAKVSVFHLSEARCAPVLTNWRNFRSILFNVIRFTTMFLCTRSTFLKIDRQTIPCVNMNR